MFAFPRQILATFCALVTGCAVAADPNASAFASVKALGRGVNLGNALDAPNEGEWGITIKPEYLTAIRKAGFQHVRVPVRWSNHAKADAPFTIDEKFFARVDEVLDQATKAGLQVVLDLHHYDELYPDPAAHRERFFGLWKQIAEHYKDRPDSVLFEPLNEPNGKLTPSAWNDLFADVLRIIRKSNPTRIVVVGPGQWNGFRELKNLRLPADDRRLLVTFHYYEPFEFTHQGATWVKDSDKWLGRTWTGSDSEKAGVRDAFTTVTNWSEANRRPIYLGEFGAFSKADMDSRARWTTFVRSEAERRGFAWAYWEFGSTFGVFNPETNQWREPLLRALIPGKN